MNVARILYPVKVLGPGNRVGVWVCGCARGCKGCSNPELWDRKKEYEISIDKLVELIKKIAAEHCVDGFTITGGEPFDQPEELYDLVKALGDISKDIIVYSGYTIDELRDSSITGKVLSHIAVLIDGPYIEEQNTDVVMRGSDNQRVHLLKDKYRILYEKYMKTSRNVIQNFTTTDGVVSVGIHRPGFGKEIASELCKKVGEKI